MLSWARVGYVSHLHVYLCGVYDVPCIWRHWPAATSGNQGLDIDNSIHAPQMSGPVSLQRKVYIPPLWVHVTTILIERFTSVLHWSQLVLCPRRSWNLVCLERTGDCAGGSDSDVLCINLLRWRGIEILMINIDINCAGGGDWHTNTNTRVTFTLLGPLCHYSHYNQGSLKK